MSESCVTEPVSVTVATAVPVVAQPCWWQRDMCGLKVWIWILLLVILLIIIGCYGCGSGSGTVCEDPCEPPCPPTTVSTPAAPALTTDFLRFVNGGNTPGDSLYSDLAGAADPAGDRAKLLSGITITPTEFILDFSKIGAVVTPVVRNTAAGGTISYTFEATTVAGDPESHAPPSVLNGQLEIGNIVVGDPDGTTDITYKVVIPITPAVSAELLAEKMVLEFSPPLIP